MTSLLLLDRFSHPAASTTVRRPLTLVWGAWWWAVLVGLFVTVTALALSGRSADGWGSIAYQALYNGTLVLAAGLTITAGIQSLRDVGRASLVAWGWIAIGAGLLAWAMGNLYWSIALSRLTEEPFPSAADAMWLLLYPLAYVGGGLLVRARVARFPTHFWLDGLIGATVVAAIAAQLMQPIVQATGGSVGAVATNLAYPLGDMTLLLLLAVAVVAAWRDPAWGLLAGGLLIFAVTDSVYLAQIAKGSYVDGGLLDLGWAAAFIVVAAAARVRASNAVVARTVDGWSALIVPAAFGTLAVVVQGWNQLRPFGWAAYILGLLALLLVIVRLVLTFGDHLSALRKSQRDALVDPLTELPNRRALMTDLEHALEEGQPHVLALFDLDGFKSYNDTFGHSAGDAVLVQLGARLREAVGERGRAYRLGGDEFCALVHGNDVSALLRAGDVALSSGGQGYAITVSGGATALHLEAGTASDVLSRADDRMYAAKGDRLQTGTMTRLALIAALAERDHRLDDHIRGVADLATAIGRRLGLSPIELEELTAGAELHDIGKVAIPDAILYKPGPLTEEEQQHMRLHTVMGERILASVPALSEVARIVRWSHEHWDGTGYPDRLAGEQIPRASRIVAVCDAFEAMTSDRPYRRGISAAEALAELERCSGTQFDPEVVTVFRDVLAASRVADEASSARPDEAGRVVPARAA